MISTANTMDDATISVSEVAKSIYEGFTDNERHGVKFGIFPFEKMNTPLAKSVNHHALVVEMMRLTRTF